MLVLIDHKAAAAAAAAVTDGASSLGVDDAKS